MKRRYLLVPLAAIALLAVFWLSRGGQPTSPPGANASPSAEEPSANATPTAARAPQEAVAASRAFLTGYLNYLYGSGTLQAIPDVTPAIRGQLPNTLTYVSAEERPGGYNVLGMQTNPQTGGAFDITAQVSGAQPNSAVAYEFIIAPQGSLWEVISVPTRE